MRLLNWITIVAALVLAPLTSGAQAPVSNPAESADSMYFNDRYPEAISRYRRAVARDSLDGRSWARLGIALMMERDWASAIAASQRAASLSPISRGSALYTVAVGEAQLGRIDASLRALEGALDAGYLSIRSLGSDALLEPLRDTPGFVRLARRVFGPYYEPRAKPTRTPPTRAQIETGIRHFTRTVRSRHPSPYRYWTVAQWDSAERAALSQAGHMSESEYLVTLMRMASALGDVHSAAFPGPGSRLMRRAVQLGFWKFPEGLFIRTADSAHRDLLGAQVLAMNGRGADDIWKGLLRDFYYENEWMAANTFQFYLRFPEFLRALGIGRSDSTMALRLRMPDGKEREVTIATLDRGWDAETEMTDLSVPKGWVEDGAVPRPLWLLHRDRNYWLQVIPEQRAVYMQINNPRDDPERPWTAFLDTLVATVQRQRAERLVIDLRHNPGGWSPMAFDLAWRLREVPQVNRPGHLFVLISRITQSAGVTIAVELERNAHALFVGEPLGAHPNFFNGRQGNHVRQSLPGTSVVFRVSEVSEQNSYTIDTRRFIAPDIAAPLGWEAYRTGRDPALEAALHADPASSARLLLDAGGRALDPVFRWQRPSQYPAFAPRNQGLIP